MTKILVIEDEESVRDNILDLLEAEDFVTIAAGNGLIGLQLAFTEVPDLILCDLMLPELDGYGVLTALREEPVTATIPFIFLTARSARADFRLGMDLGADDYLTKPFTRTELLSAIASRLAKQTVFSKLGGTTSKKILLPEQQILEMCLRRTVEGRNFQQFQVYYQPIVNLHSGKIIAAESLLRWQHPELGMVSPSDLIPVAESTGLIVPIGEWMLENVCRQGKIWQNAGLSLLHLAVNISLQQLIQPDFSQKIIKLLRNHNFVPKCLGLELTESMIMQDVNSAITVMQEIQDFGIKIAIDDFGTGYTSLVYLKKLPI
ncbi:MAG: EAL domain-containing response regulator, partial [Scytonema sp. PMC 1069.18]|nr:EAL domain-containing response regulator [Scytonema sp. PMC 1069.18]